MIIPDFSDLHMLVVGDVMIDRYVYGRADRISPEAPVPVFALNFSEDRLGGAANVCANLLALGAKVTLVSICGNDDEYLNLQNLLSTQANLKVHLTAIEGRKTTVKSRIMANHQHLLRIDSESIEAISSDKTTKISADIADLLSSQKIDGVIMQDYNKGFFSKTLIDDIIKSAQNNEVPTFVDPKFEHFFDYKGCTFFKPNQKELFVALGNKTIARDDIHAVLKERLGHQVSFVTLGKDGIYYNDGTMSGVSSPPYRNISDVCGAGDTVISIASLCYCKGLDLASTAQLANIAGGQVCELPGVAVINLNSLKNEAADS